jgi:hypothetical protein
LVFGDADFGRAFLELDRVAPSMHGTINHLFGDVERAIVIDANFGNNENGLTVSDKFVSDFNVSHCQKFSVVEKLLV